MTAENRQPLETLFQGIACFSAQYAAGCTVQCAADGVSFWGCTVYQELRNADACKIALPEQGRKF